MTKDPAQQIQVAIAWCLIDANQRDAATLETLRNHFYQGEPCGEALQATVTALDGLFILSYPETITQLQGYTQQFPILWEKSIGLVYGGATKIKPYLFDVPKLHEIRGASALLDNINLVDLPAFLKQTLLKIRDLWLAVIQEFKMDRITANQFVSGSLMKDTEN